MSLRFLSHMLTGVSCCTVLDSFFFNFLLWPSSLGSAAPPTCGVIQYSHVGGLDDDEMRSRWCTESVRRYDDSFDHL